LVRRFDGNPDIVRHTSTFSRSTSTAPCRATGRTPSRNERCAGGPTRHPGGRIARYTRAGLFVRTDHAGAAWCADPRPDSAGPAERYGAAPYCAKNAAFLERQKAEFLKGERCLDFAAENYEVNNVGRATFDDLTDLGRRQMGCMPW
jgi:hypothetical protein